MENRLKMVSPSYPSGDIGTVIARVISKEAFAEEAKSIIISVLDTMVPHLRMTGHNAADREIRATIDEAARLVRNSGEEAQVTAMIEKLATDVVPHVRLTGDAAIDDRILETSVRVTAAVNRQIERLVHDRTVSEHRSLAEKLNYAIEFAIRHHADVGEHGYEDGIAWLQAWKNGDPNAERLLQAGIEPSHRIAPC
jgi:hypothetical protein